jgi:hypothetical protein
MSKSHVKCCWNAKLSMKRFIKLKWESHHECQNVAYAASTLAFSWFFSQQLLTQVYRAMDLLRR